MEDSQSNQRKESMFDNSKTFKEEIKTAQERKDEFDDMMTYNADLMKQKTHKAEQNKREQHEEKMEDKRMLEGLMNKIVKEDLESATCKLEMKEKMRCEMVESQEQQKVFKQNQKSFDLKEEQHFRQEDLDTIDYDGIACAQRAEKFENKERSNEKIYRAVQEKEAKTQRRDDLVKNLQEQQHLEQDIQDEIAQKEKVKQTNRDVQDVLIWQMQYKIDVAAEERVRDAGFVHMAQQQMFDDDEKERDKELKKKEEQKKYAQELRQQILENEVRRKKNIETENQRQHVEDENDRAYYNR